MNSNSARDIIIKNSSSIDNEVLDYIDTVIQDLDTFDLKDLEGNLIEILIGHGICENNENALRLCKEIHQNLNKSVQKNKKSIVQCLEVPLVLSTIIEEQDQTQSAIGISSIPKGFHKKNKELKENETYKQTSGYLAKVERESKVKKKLETYNPKEYQKEKEEAFLIYMKVNIDGFSLYSPKNVLLLDNVSLKLPNGRKFGLIGRNGEGKTCLLREIAFYRIESFPKNLRVLLVEQEIVGDDTSVIETVMNSDMELNILLKKLELGQTIEENSIHDITESIQISERLNELEAYNSKSRATIILKGLNFSDEMLTMATKNLSGGWRMRVSLAAALFVRPDLLLLDEPTNHLDFPTIIWLQTYLQQYNKTLVVVSHDREFLDSVVTDIIQLKNKTLQYYRGNYSNFIHIQNEQYLSRKKAYLAQQLEIAHIMTFITTYYSEKKSSAQDKKTKMVESRKKKLEKMELLPDPDKELKSNTISLQLPNPSLLRKAELIQTDSMSFGFIWGKHFLSDLTLRIEATSRIAILGANGSGKSTLIKLLIGKLEPQKGRVIINSNATIGLFAQHHIDELDLTQTPIECLRSRFPNVSVKEIRKYLGRFALNDELQLLQIGNLSGGQKSRVAFSIIVKCEPHLLILDEPTNHLDMETIDSLILALKNFTGALLLVSHDQFFLKEIVTEFWALGNGHLKTFYELSEAQNFSYN